MVERGIAGSHIQDRAGAIKDGATLIIWDDELNRELVAIKIGSRGWLEWLEGEGPIISA